MSLSGKVAHELNEADERILDELASGRNLPQNLANELGYSRQYVQNRLQMLKAADYVTNVGGGLYELVDDPRGEADEEGASLDDIRNAVREAREAYEDVDGNGVEDAIARLEELTGESNDE